MITLILLYVSSKVSHADSLTLQCLVMFAIRVFSSCLVWFLFVVQEWFCCSWTFFIKDGLHMTCSAVVFPHASRLDPPFCMADHYNVC